jgi:hypothetical protein
MRTRLQMLLHVGLAALLLGVLILSFGCGSAGSPSASLTDKQVSDDVGGTTYYISPTPDSGAFIYAAFTAKCDGYVIGGTSRKAVYTFTYPNSSVFYTVTKTTYPNYQQVIPVPDNYFGYMHLNVKQYGKHADSPYNWELCGEDNINYVVDTF